MKNDDFKLLLNPFYKVAGWKAVFIGLIFVCATTLLGYLSNTTFFGIEVKYVHSVTIGRAFALHGAGLGVYFVVMYLVSVILARGVRMQDILGTVMLSRYPLIFAAIPGFFITLPDIDFMNPTPAHFSEMLHLLTPTLLGAVFMMIFSIWSLVVMYNGFKTSTGLKGARCGVGYALTIIIAEIVTLLLVFKFF